MIDDDEEGVGCLSLQGPTVRLTGSRATNESGGASVVVCLPKESNDPSQESKERRRQSPRGYEDGMEGNLQSVHTSRLSFAR